MKIGLGLGLSVRRSGAQVAASPVQSIAADGWQATYPSPPSSFNPVGSPVALTVQRAGFNTAAQPVTVSDTLVVMSRVRQPFPSQGTLTTSTVALSDFVHAGDVVPGVVNNSTVAAPKPIACWLTADCERARGSTYTVRLAVHHAYARSGQPVAAVRFSATDGTNTVTQLVSTVSSRQYGSGLFAPYFEWAIPLAGLNQGVSITVDATIYPWVGAAFTLSASGNTYPSINLTTLTFINDRTGAYGEAYAYVDLAGNNATGVVSATPGTAAAAPFATIAGAAAAIRTFNNTNYTRNDASGGTIRLNVGEHVLTAFLSTTTAVTPLVIEAASLANKATTIIKDSGVTASNTLPAKVKLKDLTIKKIGASVTLFDNAATLATLGRQLTLENVTIDLNGTSAYNAFFWKVGRMFMLDCASANNAGGLFDSFSGACKEVTMVGCSGGLMGNLVYNAIASRISGSNTVMQRVTGVSQTETGHGQMVLHSHLTQRTDGQQAFNTSATPIDSRGLAIVGTVIEHTGGVTAPAIRVHADGDTNAVENVNLCGVTVVGSRINYFYQDVGTTTISKRGYVDHCVFREANCKTDVFGTNGALVGNWSAAYHVGWRGVALLRGGSDGNSVPGVGRWMGEIASLGDVSGTAASPLVTNWVDDESFDSTTKLGFGDYTPGPGNVLPTIPAGLAPYPIDQKGRPVSNTGTAKVGAIMP